MKLSAKLLPACTLAAIGVSQPVLAAGSQIALSGSVRPFSASVRVLGDADSRSTVEFQVALKMRDLSQLRSRIALGQRVTPEELEANHFPLLKDQRAVVEWLTAQGLKVERTYPNRLTIEVSGTVAQVRAALGVDFKRVVVDSEEFVAARTAPLLPAEFSASILGINGLQPYQKAVPLHTRLQPQSPTKPFVPAYSVNDILTAYSGTGLGLNGSGQTIAILIDVAPQNSDLTTFWTNSGIPGSLTNITAVQGANPRRKDKPSGEETLDTEMTSGVAPAAKIRLYLSGTLSFSNLDKALQKLIAELPSQPTLHQLTISLGSCEASNSSSQLQTDSQLLSTIAASGVSIFVSSGDDGSKNLCNSGLGVSYYASDPSVTAVGGTTLTLDSSSGAVTSEGVWNNQYGASGGGISSYFSRPSWQVGAGVPAGTTRLVPDVALDADPNTGVYVVYNGRTYSFGGTSASSPLWAGFTALFNQARAAAGKPSLGLLGPRLYPLLGTSNFRDITSGNNGAYSAGSGYDLATGIGVPVLSLLQSTLFNQP
ncbi:S53 family peptidase [Gloeobacter kilaueensis]|uniref:Peptidase S53 propeptide n=1 Tax=Gloeobacter kilaueensis (strain ATCC BAA-2537 / CCAP 1431/1 / ULC 316 / JS1) TaxID=1183438 RepID=U5QIP1_GLOK1|nr:S53 family peptidase [Gloeobacter kilaueensis]AGY58758.1 peptidase S53 propeptide [Gloeobacter kilaueensis JS1]